MTITDRQADWDHVHTTKAEAEVHWLPASPAASLALVHATGVPGDTAIVDLGGGASRLVDALPRDGYSAMTVLDLSDHALAAAWRRQRVVGAVDRHPMWPRGRHLVDAQRLASPAALRPG